MVDRTLMMKIPATQMNEFCTRRCRIFFLKITNLKFDTKTSCWCWWLGCSDLLSCNLVSSNKCDLVSSNTQTQLTMSLNTCRALSTFTITIRVNSEWFSKNLRFLGGCVDQGKLFVAVAKLCLPGFQYLIGGFVFLFAATVNVDLYYLSVFKILL